MFAISKRDETNVVSVKVEKTQLFALGNIVTVQFQNKYFYSITKLERVLYSDCVNAICLCRMRVRRRLGVTCS